MLLELVSTFPGLQALRLTWISKRVSGLAFCLFNSNSIDESIASNHVVGDAFTMEQEPCGSELARDRLVLTRQYPLGAGAPNREQLLPLLALPQFRHTQLKFADNRPCPSVRGG